MNSYILLTGGAGYIGSHTAVELLQQGYNVIIADNFSNSSRSVVQAIKEITQKDIILYDIDVSDENKLKDIFETYSIDSVIHFAGLKSVGESVLKPLKYYDVNLNSIITVLKIMEQYQVKKLVFSSSATVYGAPKSVPITEDMPTGCKNPYGWTKWIIEQILKDITKANPEMSVVLLRYFNPIGAHPTGLIGELPQGIPNNLMPYISMVADGKLEKLHIYGDDYDTPDGTGVRDYIHVVDLAKGHIAALSFIENHTGIEIFNLGTGSGYSVLDVVHAFEQATGVKIPYQIDDRRAGDVSECYASTDKAEKMLNWKAKYNLEQMCNHTWRWQKIGYHKIYQQNKDCDCR